MKSVQKNFRTGKIEDQTPEPAGFKRGMETVLRQAFHAGWVARHVNALMEEDRAFAIWAKDI